MSHFWVIVYNIDKSITFFLHIICHDFSSISIYLLYLTLASSVCCCMSEVGNFQPITELVAFLLTKLRNHATSHSLPNRPTFTLHAKTDDGYARDHQRAWQAEKSVRDVNKKMSEAGVKPRNSNSEVKELYFCGSTTQTARNMTFLIYFSTRIPMVSIRKQNF